MEPQPAEESFEKFFSEYTPRLVRRVAVMYGATLQDAEDVAQLAMISAQERWDTIEHPAGWVLAVSKNLMVRVWSRRSRQAEQLVDDMSAFNAFGLLIGVDVELQERQILDWIKSLPAAESKVADLAYHGYSQAEIAKRLKISVATVKRRLHAVGERAMGTEADQAADGRGPALPIAALWAALEDLSPAQRRVITLTVEGYTPTQIAGMLDSSANATRVNLCKARAKLVKALGCKIEEIEHRIRQLQIRKTGLSA